MEAEVPDGGEGRFRDGPWTQGGRGLVRLLGTDANRCGYCDSASGSVSTAAVAERLSAHQASRSSHRCSGHMLSSDRSHAPFTVPSPALPAVPGSLGPRLAALRPRHLPSRPVPQLLPPVHHPPARPVLPAHQRAPPLTAAIRPCRERRGAGRGAGGWQWGWQGRQGWREWLNHQRLCRGQCWAERGSGGVAGGAGGAGAGVRGRDGWRACGWGGHPGVARDRGSEESIGRRRGCEQRGGIRNRQEGEWGARESARRAAQRCSTLAACARRTPLSALSTPSAPSLEPPHPRSRRPQACPYHSAPTPSRTPSQSPSTLPWASKTRRLPQRPSPI